MIFKKYNLFLLATLFCNYSFCPESATQTEYQNLLNASSSNASLDRTNPAYYEHESGVILLRRNSQKYKDDSWHYFSRAGMVTILASAAYSFAEKLKKENCSRLSNSINLVALVAGGSALCITFFYAPWLWREGRKSEKEAEKLKNLYVKEAREQTKQKASA